MTYQPAALLDDPTSLPNLPDWASQGRSNTSEMLAFRAGSVLTVLDAMICNPHGAVPMRLFANRMAVWVATATSKLEGRMAREADIRDAYHLTPAGDARGPDGDLLAFWREAARLAPSDGAALAGIVGPDFESALDGLIALGRDRAQSHGPMAGCASVLRATLSMDDRAERIACLLSDIVLARALNWPTVLPISSAGLNKAALRALTAEERDAELAVQTGILRSAEAAIVLAQGLARAAAALMAVAPKLRAKGSEAAVALFLAEDAVAPSSMLSPVIRGTSIPMTGRAARRFCDRLVELGVARELTGRATFRLYGISP